MKRTFSKQPKSAVTSASAIKAGSALDTFWKIYDGLSLEESKKWDHALARKFPAYWDGPVTEEMARWALTFLESGDAEVLEESAPVTSARAVKAGSAIDKYWEIYDNLSPEEAQEWDRVVARRYPSFWDREMTEEVAEWALSVKGVDPDEDDDDENIVTIVMTALSDAGFDVSSFEDAGLLTKNDGFVIRKGGQDYQFSLLGSWRG